MTIWAGPGTGLHLPAALPSLVMVGYVTSSVKFSPTVRVMAREDKDSAQDLCLSRASLYTSVLYATGEVYLCACMHACMHMPCGCVCR